MDVITMQRVTKRYGSRRGIDDVDLRVPEGSLYGFLGPNGAGKTTSIRVLLGFLRPTSGSAQVLGMDCWRDSAQLKAEVGAIPGDLRLWPWLTGTSALKLFGRIRGRDMLKQGSALADELKLDLSVKVRAMSRGMRQKLGLILSMAHAPRLLILDEPTTALDPLMQETLRRILRRMASQGHTVFFSSHTLGEVEDLCERVAIVKQGRIVADTTLDALKRTAFHDVDIVWREHAAVPAPPSWLRLTTHSPRRWSGRLEGDVAPLLAMLAHAGPSIEDVRIARPSLETLFQRFYADEAVDPAKGAS